MSDICHASLANAIRALAMDGVEAAKSGHPGMPLGMADVASVLFSKIMKFDAADPHWFDRDRFVLSAGHGSMLVYALLYLTGVEGMTIEELKNFRQLGSKTPGHPEYGHTAGVEVTSGPLGSGLATAVGMAIAERRLNAEFGDDLVNHKTYVMAGDGCLMEGLSQEAISLAGHLQLDHLVVLWDDNGITIDGAVSLSDSTDQLARFAASNWAVSRIDGHDPAAILAALNQAGTQGKPTLIACKTTIGYGAPTRAGTSKAHGEPLGAAEIAGARVALNWPHAPFEIPADILAAWRAIGSQGAQTHAHWQERLAASPLASELKRRSAGTLPASLNTALAELKATLVQNKPALATRKASEMALEVINPVLPETLGGSADLTPSNNTKTTGLTGFNAQNRAGRYLHYGIREFGMGCAMNGIALHGGLIPYGGTFMVFSDYNRPALRLAALQGLRVIHVLTHDSIGLGEDGPTHQPVEHAASLRAIPNLLFIRPADGIETAECWEIALNQQHRPSALALTRQNLPTVRADAQQNLSQSGAYVLAGIDAADVTLFASGSEVEIALAAKGLIEAAGKTARVVSVPCFELFEEQNATYQRAVIGTSKVRVAIEAGIRQGWDRFIGENGIFVGMNGFGASAPYKDLYRHFEITADSAATRALQQLAAH